ncbi:flagellar biosynthetic protein FliR [Rhodanobacter sp. KK11]|uniref:flagellar biosynthetic protein FliR n=1 Tax=Rhodanobacter sp. KK11 TaxID=3083255 RepID=UPI0029668879|nr:flagellar biosynthetic protein FliR [Rhodanobacter sp. KK11]MDW2981783.1 flagellar biosynthetic protein FliR [Rhodanobacter sp. KK11]
MAGLELIAIRFLLATARFTPVLAVPALTPFAFVPVFVRLALLLAVGLLTAGVAPVQTGLAGIDQPIALGVALLGEMAMGLTLALAVVLPGAAIGMAANVVDVQSGASAVSIFNPSMRTAESMTGTAMQWVAALVFFALGLHLFLLRWVLASTRFAPLGSAFLAITPGAFVSLLGSQFLLGLAVVAPVILGLLGVDLAVAFASRSMPQANIYFVALPLKIAAAFLLLAADLRYAPELIGRVYSQAFGAISTGGP